MPAQDGTLLAAALTYAARGWPVFPIVPGTKRPITPNGFKNATTDPERIRAWWAATPDANVGLPTGSVSGLLVVDIDPRNGGDVEWQLLVAQFGEPVTRVCLTPSGGKHYYFNLPPGRSVKTRVGVRPGIDIKGEGGYVLAPPSRFNDLPYVEQP